MIILYVSPSCQSCRKVKEYFKENNVEFKEKNIFTCKFTDEEILNMIKRSENGTDDIISTRSKIIKENKIDINSMKLSELIQFIKNNPSILKRPIIINDNVMNVGYNKDEITVFLPLAKKLANSICPFMGNCDGTHLNK